MIVKKIHHLKAATHWKQNSWTSGNSWFKKRLFLFGHCFVRDKKKYEQERKVVGEETSSCIFFCLCSVVVSFLIFKLNYTKMYKIDNLFLWVSWVDLWLRFLFPRFIDKMTIKQPTRSTPSKLSFHVVVGQKNSQKKQ